MPNTFHSVQDNPYKITDGEEYDEIYGLDNSALDDDNFDYEMAEHESMLDRAEAYFTQVPSIYGV